MTISLNPSNTNSYIQNKDNYIPKEIPSTSFKINCISKELSTASLGVVISAISNVAIQIFNCNCIKIPYIIVHFITYGSIATSIAGTAIAVFSSIYLCQKFISKENVLYNAISATALGVLLTSTAGLVREYAELACDHVHGISSCFYRLDADSKVLYIGANFAWHACLIIGIASIAFTTYAVYCASKAALADVN